MQRIKGPQQLQQLQGDRGGGAMRPEDVQVGEGEMLWAEDERQWVAVSLVAPLLLRLRLVSSTYLTKQRV